MVMDQITLDLDVESFSKREKLIVQRLKEYRTMDADIRLQERLSCGIGLKHQPSASAKPPERDYLPMLSHLPSEISGEEQEVAATVARYISKDEFRYASSIRVAGRLRNTFVDDVEEDNKLQIAFETLAQKPTDEYLHLTDTERLASLREEEIENARGMLKLLMGRKETICFSLEEIAQWYPEWHAILWHKYVMGKSWIVVCEIAARGGIPLTPEEYRLSRRKALKQFDKWAPSLD